MPKICRYDLVVLPKKLTKEFGGVNQIGICFKVTNTIHLFDPITMRRYCMNTHQYFNYEHDITIIPFKGNETEFYITDIYTENQKFDVNTTMRGMDNKFARLDVKRSSDHKSFCTSTHLGHIFKHGDLAVGFDLAAIDVTGDFDHLTH